MKMTKRVLSVLAALALVVSAIPTMTVSAAPTVLATYNFEDGMAGLSDSGLNGPAPSIVQDAERGNVLQFNGGTDSEYKAGEPTQNSGTIEPGTPSSLKLDQNPFAGQSLTGATISLWVKAPAGAAEKSSGMVGFISRQYSDLPHPDTIYYEDEPNTTTEKISGQYAYGIGVGAFDAVKNLQNLMVYFSGMLSNSMWVKDEESYFINNPDTWAYMVVTIGNNAEDNRVYINGEMIGQALPIYSADGFVGKRFNHGEAGSDKEANKHEPLLMEILTASDTVAYLGYTGNMAASENLLIDDVTYYGAIASDADVKSMYETAKAGGSPTAPSGDDGSNNGGTGGGTTGTNTANKSNSASTPNLPQTGVISTGALVACGVAAVAGGTILFRKKKDEK